LRRSHRSRTPCERSRRVAASAHAGQWP
jgi:hypothetical protein